ncbi:MAG: imidazole glycerol phosphate synthase subunit HisH [Bacteroidetes bacterium]|nr:imidazole glycerol phosphate synthase subunit HisH [Bacteroidota bacterium]
MRQEIAVIKYNAGNIHSVLSALSRLGFNGILTDNPEVIYQSDKVIFPGVGEARSTMNYLKEKGLDEVIKKLTQPVLGICLGMQLLCLHSEEKDTDCLGILPIRVKKFIPQNNENVPHIGWNTLKTFNNLLFDGLKEDSFAYFVHSYYAELSSETIAQTDYIFPFSAALQKNNFFATQFHPEKSGQVGETILRNFLNKVSI